MSTRLTRRRRADVRRRAQQAQAQRRRDRLARATHAATVNEAFIYPGRPRSRRASLERWTDGFPGPSHHAHALAHVLQARRERGPVRQRVAQLFAAATVYDAPLLHPFRPQALVELARLGWVRPLHAYRADAGALVNYLLARWSIPDFLVAAMYRDDVPDAELSWALRLGAHLGRGGSLASPAARLPVPLSRRMRHAFLTSPRLPPVLALRRAQVLGAGGDEAWVAILALTPLARLQGGGPDSFEPWWHRVLTWLVHQDAPLGELESLIRWLDHVRWRGHDPVGRPLASAIRRAHQYAKDCAARARASAWTPTGMPRFDLRVQGRHWTLDEIPDAAALQAEARALAHCVWGYRTLLRDGEVALFSLKVDGRHHGTVELRLRTREVRQAKGRANTRLAAAPAQVVRHWARARGLRIATEDLGGPR